MTRTRPGHTRAEGLLAFLLCLFVIWAPLQVLDHKISVLHRWCAAHGHLIEVTPLQETPAHLDAPRLPNSWQRAGWFERGERDCSLSLHERPPARSWIATLGRGLLRPAPAVFLPRPVIGERRLSRAPKRGPPNELG